MLYAPSHTSLPRRYPLALAAFFALLAPALPAAGQDSADSVRAALQQEFSQAPPELTRYDGLTAYGATFSASRRSDGSLHHLQQLYARAVDAGLLKDPGSQTIALCHELIVFAAPEGLDCLRRLARVNNKDVADYLPIGIMAAGAAGEQIAIERLHDKNSDTRLQWSRMLAGLAIYSSSVRPIAALLSKERQPGVRDNELRALAHIGDPAALEVAAPLLAAKDDPTRAGAIFALTELRGRDALAELKQMQPAGPESKQELADAIAYLQGQTSAQSPFGTAISNDQDFWDRFGDLKNPVIDWINAHGKFERNLTGNPPLTPEEKDTLFKLLADSGGFGLEAVKGSLHVSAARADVAALLRIRQSVWISPNDFSDSRTSSLDILIRGIRRELPQLPTLDRAGEAAQPARIIH